MSYLKRLLVDDGGQDLVEYALLAAFISIVAVATLRTLGPLIDALYVSVQNVLTSAGS